MVLIFFNFEYKPGPMKEFKKKDYFFKIFALIEPVSGYRGLTVKRNLKGS